MSDVPQTTALITVAQHYAGNIVRQVNRRTVALRVIPIVVGEGKNCAFVAESDGAIAAEFAEGADAADFGSDGQVPATLAWAQLRSASRITGLARATSRTSKSPMGNIELIGRNLVNSATKLASVINQQIYSGNGAASPKQITGLTSALDDANTYATINRSTGSNAFFRAMVVDPGTPTPLSLAQIREDLGAIYDASGQNPDIALCSTSVHNALGNLFDSSRKYIQVVNTARGEIRLSAGYEGLEVGGCIFLKDKDAPAGQIQYLNTNHVRLEVLPPSDESAPVLEPGTMLTANDGFGELPLMFSYEKLAKTGDSDKYQAKVYTELVVDRPNACGVRKNVATAA